MRQHRQRCKQGTDRPRRAPRHIQHNCRSQRPANRPAQTRHRCFFPALSAHQLGHPLQQPVAHRPRCLWRYVPRSDAGSPRSNHQTGHPRSLPDCVFDAFLIVWNRNAVDGLKPVCVQRTSQRGTGKVLPLTPCAAVAHGNHSRSPTRGYMRFFRHVFDCTNSGKSLDLMRK